MFAKGENGRRGWFRPLSSYRPLRPEEEPDCEDELEDVDEDDELGAGRDSDTCGLGLGVTLGGV